MRTIKSKVPGRPRPATLHTRNVPTTLRHDFRAWCARRGYTMEAVVVACLRRTLADDKAIPEARAQHPKTQGTLNTRNVPTHLKAQFKGWCARRGYTMEAVVIACIRRAIAEDREIRDARTPNRIGG